jgi:hypothetical protein
MKLGTWHLQVVMQTGFSQILKILISIKVMGGKNIFNFFGKPMMPIDKYHYVEQPS